MIIHLISGPSYEEISWGYFDVPQEELAAFKSAAAAYLAAGKHYLNRMQHCRVALKGDPNLVATRQAADEFSKLSRPHLKDYINLEKYPKVEIESVEISSLYARD